MDVPWHWRAGFEVEVILGDLRDPQFFDLNEPMDTASPAYCRAVARELRVRTGERWSAPRVKPRKPGFYVVKEYDLDPLLWPGDRVAGVELLTPPLPINHADAVRDVLRSALAEIDGAFNFVASDHTQRCAWHINIDAVGPDRGLDAGKFILGVDEQQILALNGRLMSQYAAPQHHAYGIPLLRHLRAEPHAHLMGWTGLSSLIRHHAGEGKRYAANFSKLVGQGYLELRHYSANSFFGRERLVDLLRPVTRAFEMWAAEETPIESVLLKRYLALHGWLETIRPRLTWDEPAGGWVTVWHGHIRFDGEPIGDILWNGTAEIALVSAGERWEYSSRIFDVQWPDIPEAVAILSLDVAEHIGANRSVPPIASKLFREEVARLATALAREELQIPAPELRDRDVGFG